MRTEKEMTAPNTSVGADDGQSLHATETSIAAFSSDCKNNFRRWRAWLS